jgi:hypothetical protein
VPLGDDLDGAVDHFDGGLIVNRVRRYSALSMLVLVMPDGAAESPD